MAASVRFLAKRANYLAKMCLRNNHISVESCLNRPMTYTYPKSFSCGTVMRNNEPLSEKDVKTGMETLTDKFTEARELMDDARESEGTVYFSDDLEEAQQAVKDTLDEYNSLLSKLSEDQRQNVIRSLGLRMEELKAQQMAIEESLKE